MHSTMSRFITQASQRLVHCALCVFSVLPLVRMDWMCCSYRTSKLRSLWPTYLSRHSLYCHRHNPVQLFVSTASPSHFRTAFIICSYYVSIPIHLSYPAYHMCMSAFVVVLMEYLCSFGGGGYDLLFLAVVFQNLPCGFQFLVLDICVTD